MDKKTFETLLNTQLRDVDGFFRYVKALYDEWHDRSATGYPTLEKLGRHLAGLNADLPPQFFTGDIRAPFVIVSLNPHADAEGRKTEIAAADFCRSWEDYKDFWTNFPAHRYAGKARAKSGNRSTFDGKLHCFLSGSSSGITNEVLAKWNFFHIELFPLASPGFSMKNFDAGLYPYVFRALEAIALYPRDLIISLNRQLPEFLKEMSEKNELLSWNTKEGPAITVTGRSTKCYRQDYEVILPNGTALQIVGAPTFAAQGFGGEPLASYGRQLFSETECPIVRRALGLGSSEHFAGSDGGWLTADISDTDDSDRKVRRTAKTQKGKEKCVIPNHCGKPNRKMYELCGETIIRELLTRPFKKLRNGREANSCRISFEKNGRRYHVLKMKSENGGSELIFHCYERL